MESPRVKKKKKEKKEKKDKKDKKNKNNPDKGNGQRYTFTEDMAIVDYITSEKRYLQAAGERVWKIAEARQICPGRTFSSMKERYKKIISRNLSDYNVDKQLAAKIKQFMTANAKGKSVIRLIES